MANLRTNNLYGVSGPDTNGSALFNGTDYLTAANAAAFRVNQSSEDFTIEAWIYVTATPDGANGRIASIYHTSGNQRSYMFYVHIDDTLKFNYASSGTAGSVSTLSAGTVPHNEWVHVAVTHDASATTVRLFKNGVLKATDASAHATYYANTSGDFTTGQDFTGNISNLHINRGTCKYTADFDPYKSPIEVETNSTVLCLNSRLDVLNDDKSNTFTQSTAGGVKASTLMPFSRADAGLTFDGPISLNTQGYMYFPTGDTTQRGRGRGLIAGGSNPTNTNSIEFINIQSQGNSISFGDLVVAGQQAGASSSTRALFGMGGQASPGTKQNVIQFVTIATTGNAIDFGDRTVTLNGPGGLANQTRGIFAGGGAPNPQSDVIDFVTIATAGNATDFGNMTSANKNPAGMASPTRGLLVHGGDPLTNVIDFITIATAGDAQDFGDTTVAMEGAMAASSTTRGIIAGGHVSPAQNNTISFVTIASQGVDASDFGDLTQAKQEGAGISNNIRACFASGGVPSNYNNIDFVTIATTGNASDFGDTLASFGYRGGASDSHGGIE